MSKSEIKIFQVEDGKTEVEVKIDRDSVWLSQKQMSALFEKDTDTIGLHLKNIFQSGELLNILPGTLLDIINNNSTGPSDYFP